MVESETKTQRFQNISKGSPKLSFNNTTSKVQHGKKSVPLEEDLSFKVENTGKKPGFVRAKLKNLS